MTKHGRSGADAPSGLRPFGAEPAAQSQAKPLVPNAVFDAVAHQFSDEMGVALSGGRLRRNYELDAGNIRSAAVASVDGCHGYTCEFSSCPAQHIAEYDALEELLASAMSAFGQDAEERLEAKPASATGEAGDAQP
jgi:hypothetical protein